MTKLLIIILCIIIAIILFGLYILWDFTKMAG
jgi:hypothetical protein